jgi:hypothetical protein
MAEVTMSPNYEIVIPSEFGRSLKLRPGQGLSVLLIGNRIEIIPTPTIDDIHGLCKGMDTTIEDDPERDL